jgi:phosphoglycolate phosphatase (TIGR01487 family)
MDVPSPDVAPPLAIDIDGTLTDGRRVVDARAMAVLQHWPSPVVIATGKAFPYPVALCEFFGLEQTVIAENGGVVLAGRDGPITFEGDPEAATAAVEALAERGYGLGWGEADLVNRWRETEVAASLDLPGALVREVAEAVGLVVFDTGFAYHLTAPDVSKGSGLDTMADALDLPTAEFVAVGDSENDASMFRVANRAVAVGNADETAKKAATHVTEASYADGFLEAVAWLTD